MPVPALNPFIAPDAVCSTCSTMMEKSIKPGPLKKSLGVTYTCLECNYEVESDTRLTGQCMPVKPVKKEVA
jgi:hypothetical protein